MPPRAVNFPDSEVKVDRTSCLRSIRMPEEPDHPYGQWFKLTAAPLPEFTHEEAATEEGAAQAAERLCIGRCLAART